MEGTHLLDPGGHEDLARASADAPLRQPERVTDVEHRSGPLVAPPLLEDPLEPLLGPEPRADGEGQAQRLALELAPRERPSTRAGADVGAERVALDHHRPLDPLLDARSPCGQPHPCRGAEREREKADARHVKRRHCEEQCGKGYRATEPSGGASAHSAGTRSTASRMIAAGSELPASGASIRRWASTGSA